MAKITRKNAKIFGSTAGALEIGQFGSLAAGSVAYSTDPDTIQALTNYLEGWFAAVVGANSPAIEDMNALCYLFAYQIAYLMQEGVAEWNSATTYYIGSIVNDGSGNLYVSIVDTNLNNAVTDTTKWKPFQTSNPVSAVTSNTSLTAANAGTVFELNSAGGAFNLQLPNPSLAAGLSWFVKDATGNLLTNNVTLVRFGSEKIENVAANFALEANYGAWRLYCDGTNFYFI